MTFGGISQQLPVNSTYTTVSATWSPYDSYGTSTWTMINAGNGSLPQKQINVYSVNWNSNNWKANRNDANHTKIGDSCGVSIDGTSYNTIQWYKDDSYYFGTAPKISMCSLYLKGDPSFSVSDTITNSEIGQAMKGYLIQLVDSIILSEVYTQTRKIFLVLSDSIKILNRGWFGIPNLFSNISKSINSWINKDKN
jgi:hypothetical protein